MRLNLTAGAEIKPGQFVGFGESGFVEPMPVHPGGPLGVIQPGRESWRVEGTGDAAALVDFAQPHRIQSTAVDEPR